MSWENLCEICGKSVFTRERMDGCQVWCEECQERNNKADQEGVPQNAT